VNDIGYTRPRPLQPHGVVRADLAPAPSGPANLADILERVLDKGIVIAGDIQVNLLDIELLTIKIRLLIASVDRAKEMGIDWWESDPTLTSEARELALENQDLRSRLDRLEQALEIDQPRRRQRRETVTRQRREVADGKRRTVTQEKKRTVTERKEAR
jgi:DNA anti-recombination protein RmuC